MGKDITEKKEKKDKKDKKDKKEKRASLDGVSKSSSSKKDKKEKKGLKTNGEVTEALERELARRSSPAAEDETMVDVGEEVGELKGALVPFANPLAEDAKEVKRILRTVKKSAKTKTLRRGVKEVVKALRKSDTSAPSSSDISNPPAIVVIAADISPMDVISHLPVLCEDHNIPYIYIKSRAELGEASATKRPTSVVMIGKERNKKGKEVKESDVQEFDEAYKELTKLVVKATKTVRI